MTALDTGRAIKADKCYMTPAEFSEFSGLSISHISRLKQRGELPIISFSPRKYLINVGEILKIEEQGDNAKSK